jgi:hypothetical protein
MLVAQLHGPQAGCEAVMAADRVYGGIGGLGVKGRHRGLQVNAGDGIRVRLRRVAVRVVCGVVGRSPRRADSRNTFPGRV